MPEIEIGTETEGANCWTYQVRVFADGKTRSYEVTLGWQDYDHWSHGRVAPSRVVQQAFEFLLSKEPVDAILPRFDCAIIRRYFPEVDRELPQML